MEHLVAVLIGVMLHELIAALWALQVWIVYGDGSLGYSVAEFDTFTRHKVKSVIRSFTLDECCW